MLDPTDAKSLSRRWECIASRAELPCKWEQFVSAKHIHAPASRRRFYRLPLRTIAIMVEHKNPHAIYVRDLSREGVGFYSPICLLPRTPIWLWLPGRRVLLYRISRCRRIRNNCFECGGVVQLAK